MNVTGSGGYVDGAGFGTFQGLREDQGRGGRIQNSSYHRHIRNDVGGGDAGTYVKNTWYSNTNNCYVSSFSDGGSISCSTGWFGDGYTDTGSTKSTSWQYWETWKPLDSRGTSMRDQIQLCENITAWPDFCSPYYLRGADY